MLHCFTTEHYSGHLPRLKLATLRTPVHSGTNQVTDAGYPRLKKRRHSLRFFSGSFRSFASLRRHLNSFLHCKDFTKIHMIIIERRSSQTEFHEVVLRVSTAPEQIAWPRHLPKLYQDFLNKIVAYAQPKHRSH